jgi:hypothetical protein
LQALIDFSEPGVDVSVVALFDHEEVSALLCFASAAHTSQPSRTSLIARLAPLHPILTA